MAAVVIGHYPDINLLVHQTVELIGGYQDIVQLAPLEIPRMRSRVVQKNPRT
jgi:hypothetical protein